MAERLTIAAKPRTVLGKKVAQLRREGRLPANVYGRALESLSIELDAREFGRIIKSTSARSLFDLKVEGEAAPRPVVLRGITRKGGTGEPTHIDFYQVDPSKPINATVNLRLVGEAPAVRELAGTLLQSIENVHVKCFPLQIPEALEVDLGKLTGFDVSLTVADIAPAPGVEVLNDPSVVIASVAPPRIRLDAAES